MPQFNVLVEKTHTRKEKAWIIVWAASKGEAVDRAVEAIDHDKIKVNWQGEGGSDDDLDDDLDGEVLANGDRRLKWMTATKLDTSFVPEVRYVGRLDGKPLIRCPSCGADLVNPHSLTVDAAGCRFKRLSGRLSPDGVLDLGQNGLEQPELASLYCSACLRRVDLGAELVKAKAETLVSVY